MIDVDSAKQDAFSLHLYWTAMGADNKAHDYAIDIIRQYGSGIHVVASEKGNSWTITPIGPARVNVHQEWQDRLLDSDR